MAFSSWPNEIGPKYFGVLGLWLKQWKLWCLPTANTRMAKAATWKLTLSALHELCLGNYMMLKMRPWNRWRYIIGLVLAWCITDIFLKCIQRRDHTVSLLNVWCFVISMVQLFRKKWLWRKVRFKKFLSAKVPSNWARLDQNLQFLLKI